MLSGAAGKGDEEGFMTEINNLLTNNLRLDPWRPAQETPHMKGTLGKQTYSDEDVGKIIGREIGGTVGIGKGSRGQRQSK